MIKKIVAWICILDGVFLLGILAYLATQPGFYANSPFVLITLYLIPIFIGIGILKNSKFALICAALFFTFQFFGFYSSLDFVMPIRLTYVSQSPEGLLKLDLSAIAFFALTLISIYSGKVANEANK